MRFQFLNFSGVSWIACEQAPSEGGKKNSLIESVNPLTLDYTRLARSKTNREPVRRLFRGQRLNSQTQIHANSVGMTAMQVSVFNKQMFLPWSSRTDEVASSVLHSGNDKKEDYE